MSGDRLIAEKLAGFASSITINDIPDEVRGRAIRYLADTLACAVAAAAESDAAAVDICRDYARKGMSRPEATILGTDEKTDLRSAALANCTMARYLDANDIYMGRAGRDSGHFSDAIPALIAAAESSGASGSDLLEAIVIAYEAQGVLAEGYLWMKRGFHAVSEVPVGVALGAGRLLGLSEVELTHAASLAVTSGLMLQSWLRPAASLPSIKSGAAGMTAERGVMAAELAAAGMTGPPDAFETLFELFPSDEDLQPFDWLGRQWTTPQNAIKPVPAQIFTQAAVQCAEQLYADGLRLADLETLTVRSNDGCCGRVQGSQEAFKPETREAADHSTPFVVASTLENGSISPATYDGAPWFRDDLRNAMSRMNLIIDPVWDERMNREGLFGAEITATDRSGREYHAEVRQFSGHPDRPLSDDELIAKLSKFLDRPTVQGPGAGQRLYDACVGITAADGVGDLLTACRL